MLSSPILLSQLNLLIKDTLKNKLEVSYWVIAEISELKVNSSGHCYLEMVEKESDSDNLNAKIRATIWASTLRMIYPYFKTSTGIELGAGIKVLVKANVEFHPLYGLSLNIFDIDPTYTVGELVRQKQSIIQRLFEEGVIEMNKELLFPVLPKKIAIISSLTAAGYEDFCNQIINNLFGFKYYLKLFPSLMQGKESANSIINSLEKINKYSDFFDLVVIIRGGGSQIELDCFNNYWLAYHIAQFPLPVITGIGHEKDETIVDIVAHNKLKTPTAVAEFLIAKMLEQKDALHYYIENISDCILNKLIQNKEIIISKAFQLNTITSDLVNRTYLYINNYSFRLAGSVQLCLRSKNEILKHSVVFLGNNTNRLLLKKKLNSSFLGKELKLYIKNSLYKIKHCLAIQTEKINHLNPEFILKRGYSITRLRGKRITDSKELKKGDVIETLFYKGKSSSKIINKAEKNEIK